MEKVAEGRRGEVYRKEIDGKVYAEKRAKSPLAFGALEKEALLLQKLTQAGVSAVPAYVDSGSGWLCSERRDGDSFHKVWSKQDTSTKKDLARKLLRAAYDLDICGIIHGELHRPMANVRVDTLGNLTILDFERWTLWDSSGKNMRAVAQWLLREKLISMDILIWLWKKSRQDIYTTLSNILMASADSTELHWRKYVVWRAAVLLFNDLLTKYLFFDLRIGEQLRFLTPVLNTWAGRSIGIPWRISVCVWCIVSAILIRWRKHHHLPVRTAAFIIGGAFGNMYDRILFQGVRDMIDLQVWPVFNLADVWLTIWTWLYILRVIRHRHL